MSEIPKVDSVYYGDERNDVASLIPLDAKSALDIGFGYGGIGSIEEVRIPDTVLGFDCIIFSDALEH